VYVCVGVAATQQQRERRLCPEGARRGSGVGEYCHAKLAWLKHEEATRPRAAAIGAGTGWRAGGYGGVA
jgi:hypothetical protein